MSRLTTVVLGLTSAAVTLTGGLVAAAPTSPSQTVQVAAADVSADPALTSAIDEILSDTRLNGAMVSLAVRDANTGEAIYERNVDQRLNPASNMKLFTSAAAMDVASSSTTPVRPSAMRTFTSTCG